MRLCMQAINVFMYEYVIKEEEEKKHLLGSCAHRCHRSRRYFCCYSCFLSDAANERLYVRLSVYACTVHTVHLKEV